MKEQAHISQTGVEGALMALSPFTMLSPFIGAGSVEPPFCCLIVALVAAIACCACAFTVFHRPFIGKSFGGIAIAGSYASALPNMASNPITALTGSVALIGTAFMLVSFRINTHDGPETDPINRSLQRALWAAGTVPFLILLNMLLGPSDTTYAVCVIAASFIIAQALFVHWAFTTKSKWPFLLSISGCGVIGLTIILSSINSIPPIAFVLGLLTLVSLPRSKFLFNEKEHWWEALLDYPARLLLFTFFVLCVFGAILLNVSIATKTGAIDWVDAAFTSVSAVCVTGLVVLDTPNDFTLFGQFVILLLIQLGGLGIMSIAAVALHALGRRLSLKQESLLASLTDTDHRDLFHSLAKITIFTSIAEAIGTFLLTILFVSTGDTLDQALWRGTFTSISAFCNAGFALQSDSFAAYQNNPVILHVIATLIVLGGMAPATSLVVSKWLRGKQIPIPARIALITTLVLLLSGTFFFLAFEWDGVLAGLSFGDKLQNAWFQSVTLRTAGFYSVDIAKVASPTFLIILCFMFIGGSPGGTAGGVKTTTIGILALTFWANVTSKDSIVFQNRRIRSGTVYRAITIVASGVILWLVIVLMLDATQQMAVRDVVFETMSALGTVGLSTGATPRFDEIGKIIVIIAMFVGRIGPMTLSMVLSDDQLQSASRCPDAKISLS